jgi:hypothetical protein
MNTAEKNEALDALAALMEQLPIYNAPSLIGKAMFRACELGLNFNDAHAEVRRHFRRHGVHHWVWWTKKLARGSWKFAKDMKKIGTP